MESGLRWILRGMIALFFLLTIWMGFWTVVAGPRLDDHPRNPRLKQRTSPEHRGGIYTQKGEALSVTNQYEDHWVREFSAPLSLSHVIGYAHARYGTSGLEAYFDDELRGIQSDGYRSRPSGPAMDVLTTLDLRLQSEAQSLLDGRYGAVIVMRPQDGAIMAMASEPTFHPDRLDEWLDGAEVIGSPFLNRATQGLYPPGSAFKPMIMAMALEEDHIAPGTLFHDRGTVTINHRAFRNDGGVSFGPLGMDEALARSSNVVFASLAAGLSPRALAHYAKRFGFGQRPTFEIPASSGHIPEPWRLDDAVVRAEIGIGQGDLLVTPLQMALFFAAVANDGIMPSPTLLHAFKDRHGDIHARQEVAGTQMMAPGTARMIRWAMERVVRDGTGRRAHVPGVRVGGKTGTAQNPHGAPHSWFVGLAPVDRPEIVVVVLVEHGGYGGDGAAPIAAQLFATYWTTGEDGGR